MPSSQTQPEVDSERPNTTENPETHRITPKPCGFYRRGVCNYGISGRGCSRAHPKPCNKLLNHGIKNDRGCTLGRDCPAFHPRMCRNSLKNGKCFVENCKYLHVRGTKRAREPPTSNPTAPPQPSHSRPSTNQTTSTHPAQHPENSNFLELMAGMKLSLDVLSKGVENQSVLLANLLKGGGPLSVPVPQITPVPVPNQQMGWFRLPAAQH